MKGVRKNFHRPTRAHKVKTKYYRPKEKENLRKEETDED